MDISEFKRLTCKPTQHFTKTVDDKGFDRQLVVKTLAAPDEVYNSGSHPGQTRVCGNGLCIVGKKEGRNFILITIYADRVLTPPRPDQMDTPEGARYAERYEKGLGRG